MDFQVILIKSPSEKYDISELACQVDFTDNINKAGVCTFPVVKSSVRPEIGNGIKITCEGTVYFVGNIFKVNTTHEDQIKVTAYDQLRYLKATDTFTFKNGETASDVVRQICGKMGLSLGQIEETGYTPGIRLIDEKDMLDTITDYIRMTLTAKKEIYYIKDIAGKIVLKNIRSSITNLTLDPESLMISYAHEGSIDGDSFNRIKLIRDNKQTGKRELYIAQDSNRFKEWGGILQYYEKLDDTVNPEQAKARADALLYLKNRVQQTLSVDALGDQDIRAGNMLHICLPELGLSKFLLCTMAKHTFTNHTHTVKIDLRLV